MFKNTAIISSFFALFQVYIRRIAETTYLFYHISKVYLNNNNHCHNHSINLDVQTILIIKFT